MVPIVCCAAAVVALMQEVATPRPGPALGAEATVMATLEDLRKGELFLDADSLEPLLAASFTVIEDGSRISGLFAFLEPIRRSRERGAVVKELRFDQTLVRVYGASAVATYRYTKSWTEGGARHREQGWSSDVFELRDDGVWLLILRHRAK